MTTYFDITTVAMTLALDEGRVGRGTFTVSNASHASVGGEAVIVPEPGTEDGWFSIEDPSRTFAPDGADQVGVDIAVPADVAPGRYGFRLRVLLAGGVPEEQYDDGPVVSFEVVAEPEPVVEEPEPVRRFPWWVVAVIGGVVAIVVIVGALLPLGGGDDGRLVFKSAANGGGSDVCTLPVEDGPKVLALTDDCADNQARSLILEEVPAGVSVGVFDSQICSRFVDWTEVDVSAGISEVTVNSFETNVAGPPVAVSYHRILNLSDAVDSDIFSERVPVTGLDALRRTIEDRDPGEGGDVVVEFDSNVALPEELLELARARDVIIWEPPTGGGSGVDGRVSCVDISTGS